MTPRARTSLALCVAAGLAACSGKSEGGPGVPHAVAIQPDSAALCIGDSLTFTAQVLDASGSPVAGARVRWSSSAPEAVAIDTASGVARALAFGAAQITATSGGVRSANPAGLDVPQDLSPEFVPDSAVLAPGDTLTLGVRLRRLSAGPVPSRTPRIAPFDSGTASLDTTGLLTARAAGRAGLSLSACGHLGGGAVDVFTPPDSATGWAYLWLSGDVQLRARIPTRGLNFTMSNGRPGFQIVGPVPQTSFAFLYEDTLALTGAGPYALDSLSSSEAQVSTIFCSPKRPFALYVDKTVFTLLTSMTGDSAHVTSYTSRTGFTAVSGRIRFRMRGIIAGAAPVDTLQAIYTFSAPLVTVTGVCP